MKNNNHKKDYHHDKFACNYYCQHAKMNQVREDKKQGKRATRRKNKKLCKKVLTNTTNCDII